MATLASEWSGEVHREPQAMADWSSISASFGGNGGGRNGDGRNGGEDRVSPPGSISAPPSSIGAVSSSWSSDNEYRSLDSLSMPTPSGKPSIRHLKQLRAGDEEIRLIEALAPKWEELGYTIDFDPTGRHVELIKRSCALEGPVACCTRVFKDWLEEKGGYQPPTWDGLIRILTDLQEHRLAAKLTTCLTSQ